MSESARDRLARFRRVLRSALLTRGFGARLRLAGLGSPERIERLRSLEEALERLPWTPWQDYLHAPADFENHQARVAAGLQFQYPFQPAPEIVFFDGSGDPPPLSAEQTLAASSGVLREQAGLILSRRLPAPECAHAILALSGAGLGHLTPADRDLLWRAFRVPVFEQFLDGDGQVMAGECEAHEGMHISPDAGWFELRQDELFLTSLAALRRPALRLGTGLRGEIDSKPCPCGRAGGRLRDLSPVETVSSSSAAAD